jgi:hypothetical protein
MPVHYLEIVTDDVDTLVGLYQHVHGLSFGAPGSGSGAGLRGDSVGRNRGRHPEAAGCA